jgi:hypothetical protein
MPTLADALRGYQPPTTSALADPIKEHFRTLPQQLATNQAAMDKTMAGMYQTDILGKPNPNYYPEAVNEFTQMMPMVGALTAWHGTPHKILGKFDINKVGTGEGVQHYGHGMYFAESPEVASTFKSANSPVVRQAEMLLQASKNDPIKAELMAKAEVKRLAPHQDAPYLTKGAYQEAVDAHKYLRDLRKGNVPEVGNLYKVDIPDEHIPKILNWYESFENQPKDVQEALRNLGPEITFGSGKESVADWLKTTGNLPPHLTKQSGNAIYSELSKQLGGDKQASEYLNNLGIKGIQYENFQVKKGRGADTYNYVMFDPSDVKILEENGKPLSRKEVIQQQIDKIE